MSEEDAADMCRTEFIQPSSLQAEVFVNPTILQDAILEYKENIENVRAN